MMDRENLLEGLQQQAKELPLRNPDALDIITRRSEMLVRRIFGDSHPYFRDLQNISYHTRLLDPTECEIDEAWSSGRRSLVNLISTMLEEVQVFESAPIPILAINDDMLRERTLDILAAQGNFDRVLREATTILEDRIRGRVPFDDLSKLIPKSGDQTGDNLIGKLFGGKSPVLECGDPQRQSSVHRMLGGVVAYLRNPSHHAVDDSVKWSWAWSVVGLVDQLRQ